MNCEIPVEFQCAGSQLFGIIHGPAQSRRRGVVILTGRYCCGYHRWFVLQAREWARAGYPVLRFSARGTGDSEGSRSSFEGVGPDFASAIDEFFRRKPDLEEVVLWGFCGHASEALLYAPTDPRVSAVVLVNLYLQTHLHGRPVPGETAGALAYLVVSMRRARTLAFWKRILRGNVNWISALHKIDRNLLTALGINISRPAGQIRQPTSHRLAEAFREFQGRVLLIFGGTESIAQIVLSAAPWRGLCSSKLVEIHELRDADHMFSRRLWSDQVCSWTLAWLNSW